MRTFFTKLGNFFMKPLLKSPFHFFISSSIMLITFTGRKSGKAYTIPVQYRRDGNNIIFFTQKSRVWWKNLQNRASVTLRLCGHDVKGIVEAIVMDQNTVQKVLKQMYPAMKDEQLSSISPTVLMVKITI